MEGPYFFTLTKLGQEVSIKAGSSKVRVKWKDYVEILTTAVTSYLEELRAIFPTLGSEEMSLEDTLRRVKLGHKLTWDGKSKPKWIG